MSGFVPINGNGSPILISDTPLQGNNFPPHHDHGRTGRTTMVDNSGPVKRNTSAVNEPLQSIHPRPTSVSAPPLSHLNNYNPLMNGGNAPPVPNMVSPLLMGTTSVPLHPNSNNDMAQLHHRMQSMLKRMDKYERDAGYNQEEFKTFREHNADLHEELKRLGKLYSELKLDVKRLSEMQTETQKLRDELV